MQSTTRTLPYNKYEHCFFIPDDADAVRETERNRLLRNDRRTRHMRPTQKRHNRSNDRNDACNETARSGYKVCRLQEAHAPRAAATTHTRQQVGSGSRRSEVGQRSAGWPTSLSGRGSEEGSLPPAGRKHCSKRGQCQAAAAALIM